MRTSIALNRLQSAFELWKLKLLDAIAPATKSASSKLPTDATPPLPVQITNLQLDHHRQQPGSGAAPASQTLPPTRCDHVKAKAGGQAGGRSSSGGVTSGPDGGAEPAEEWLSTLAALCPDGVSQGFVRHVMSMHRDNLEVFLRQLTSDSCRRPPERMLRTGGLAQVVSSFNVGHNALVETGRLQDHGDSNGSMGCHDYVSRWECLFGRI